MLNYIWSFLILIGIVISSFTGNVEEMSEGILTSAKDATELLIMMAGIVGMWSGFLSVAEGSGLTKRLTKNMKPLLSFLFPNIPDNHISRDYISSNFIANILGLGWACTPTGLSAMKSLKQLELERGYDASTASNEMCTFLILNISSLQLIPMNMIAYRSQYGSTAPMAVIAPGLISTAITTFLAVILCRILCRNS